MTSKRAGAQKAITCSFDASEPLKVCVGVNFILLPRCGKRFELQHKHRKILSLPWGTRVPGSTGAPLAVIVNYGWKCLAVSFVWNEQQESSACAWGPSQAYSLDGSGCEALGWHGWHVRWNWSAGLRPARCSCGIISTLFLCRGSGHKKQAAQLGPVGQPGWKYRIETILQECFWSFYLLSWFLTRLRHYSLIK